MLVWGKFVLLGLGWGGEWGGGVEGFGWVFSLWFFLEVLFV